jgi:hypothetical protein
VLGECQPLKSRGTQEKRSAFPQRKGYSSATTPRLRKQYNFKMLKKATVFTRPAPAVISPSHPESAKTDSSPWDAPFRRQGRRRTPSDSFLPLLRGVAKAALYCAHRTSTIIMVLPRSLVLPPGMGTDDLLLRACNEGSPRPRVARAQKIIRPYPLLCEQEGHLAAPRSLFQHPG